MPLRLAREADVRATDPSSLVRAWAPRPTGVLATQDKDLYVLSHPTTHRCLERETCTFP